MLARAIVLTLGCLLACTADDAAGSGESGLACGDDPMPTVGACPPACTGGCDGGVCTILCEGFAVCDSQTIACPPELACRVVCDGGDACDSSTVACPEGFACDVDCVDGTDACGDLEIECGDASSCAIACSAAPVVCTGAAMACGGGACTATCAGESLPELTCGNACACTPC